MLLPYLLGILGVLIFAATLPATRIALEAFDPLFLTFARACIASVLAFVGLIALQRKFFTRDWALTLLAGIFLVFGFPGFMAVAMQSVPASHGAIVLGILPLATAGMARLFAHEKPSPQFWALSLAGAAVVIAFILITSRTQSGITSLSGYAWLLVAGLCAAAGYVFFGKLSRARPGWEIIARALILCLPLTLAGTVWSWQSDALKAGEAALAALAYLGLFSMFFGFCAWNAALALGGIARIGQLQLLQVFFTIAISALLLGETIDAITVLAACAVTAIIAASRNR